MGINSAKLFSAFYSTLALATILPGLALASPSLAQSGGSTGTMSAPGSSAPTGTSTAPGSSAPTGISSPQSIKLSAAQRQQLRGIVKARNTEIKGVLDKNQVSQFNQAMSAGKRPKQALEGLNLKPDQQSKIDTIWKKYQDKMQAIVSQQSSTQTAPTSAPAK